jgi:ankyrin repeat protein
MVELLLSEGVDPGVVASDGGTALEVARSFKNAAAVTILEKL